MAGARQTANGGHSVRRAAVRIRTACLERGWNRGELARRAGISRTTLYNLERGTTHRPRTSTMGKIAGALQTLPEELFGIEVGRGDSFSSWGFPSRSDQGRQRAFDRHTNPLISEVAAERPGLFFDWSEADWDELYSSFGTRGSLTRQGVVGTATEINRKRETVRQLHLVLETHLGEVAARLIEAMYEQIRPNANLARTKELAALLEQHRDDGGQRAHHPPPTRHPPREA